MLILHASLPVDPDRRADALDAAERLVEQTRREDGVLEYTANVDVREPNTIRFVERYEDEAALDAHLETDHYREFAAGLPELLAGEPDVWQFEVADATRPNL
ncbi:putative quinol monooxygenase [Halobacterium yunchengense]|uniref:putative quinol monooxygenase n=1 Tax=Halobacterium yunchengense TaxID=3108497 RepID=UPI00300A87A3